MKRTEETFTPVNPSTSELVSYRNPDGLILSTGNLYFTYHDAATASVWRAAQSALPGQEILLYSEPGARFGDIVFAQVDGAFWGYFFSHNGGATATIKRVPLTGGAATVLTTVTDVDVANSHRNLVTDGVNLYWRDVHTVRKMPIRGGTVTVLDQASPNTPTAGLALQNGNVVYASVTAIRFVPVSGATTPPSARTIVTASERVTALHTVLGFVYWGEQSGAIRVVTSGSRPRRSRRLQASSQPRFRRVCTGASLPRRGRSVTRSHVGCTSASPLGRIRCTPSTATLSASPWHRRGMSSGATLLACIGISRTDGRATRHQHSSRNCPLERASRSRRCLRDIAATAQTRRSASKLM